MIGSSVLNESIRTDGRHSPLLHHLRVIYIYDVVYINSVSRYLEGGELYDLILSLKKFTEKDAAKILH